MPKNEARLHEILGTDTEKWNTNCLVPYPKEFDKQIDLVAEAVRIAHLDPARARAMVQSFDSEPMKRWFIDVALWSGAWRVARTRISVAKVSTTCAKNTTLGERIYL